LLDEMIARRTHVSYHKEQVLNGTRRPVGASSPQMDRAARSARSQLEKAKVIDGVVDVDVEPNLFGVEVLDRSKSETGIVTTSSFHSMMGLSLPSSAQRITLRRRN